MIDGSTSVAAAIVTTVGAVVVAWISRYRNVRSNSLLDSANDSLAESRNDNAKLNRQLDQATAELHLQRKGMDFSAYMQDWNQTQRELESLCKNTPVDRFLILRAWNGQLTPKWTTAVYQYRQGEQEAIQYVHFQLDEDYVDRLRVIKSHGYLVFRVDELDPCFIKDVYMAEGVTEAVWFLLHESSEEGKVSHAITYCSFATHDPNGFSKDDKTKCMVLVGRLRALAARFDI